MDQMKKFQIWLNNTTDLKLSSITGYASAINTIKKDSEIKIKYKNFNEIVDMKSLLIIKKLYFSNEKNMNKNIIGKNRYSVAFDHYKEYIDYLINSNISDDLLSYTSNEMEKLLFEKIYDEAKKKMYIHYKNERKKEIIKKTKERMKNNLGYLYCEKCEFNKNNNEIYGENIIEGHHIMPVKKLNQKNIKINTIDNIILLCPNCHRKIHIYMAKNPFEVQSKMIIKKINL